MDSTEPSPQRYRVSRARLAYLFERYGLRDELITVGEAAAVLGVTRETIGLLVLQGRLAIAEPVQQSLGQRPPRYLLRAEIDQLLPPERQTPLPFDSADAQPR